MHLRNYGIMKIFMRASAVYLKVFIQVDYHGWANFVKSATSFLLHKLVH